MDRDNRSKSTRRLFGLQNNIRCSLMLGYLLMAAPLYAYDPITISIKGTVVATASCTFSSNETIDINFGDVYINDITGDNYKKTVPYTLTCQGDADGKTVELKWTGTGASFNSDLLTTNVTGLGIKLLEGSSQVKINAGFTIDPNAPPTLEVVLVKDSSATLSNGQEFTASATLAVNYI